METTHPSAPDTGNIVILACKGPDRCQRYRLARRTSDNRLAPGYIICWLLVVKTISSGEARKLSDLRGRQEQAAVRGELATRYLDGRAKASRLLRVRGLEKTAIRTGWHAECTYCPGRSTSPAALCAWVARGKTVDPSHRLRLIPRSDCRRAMNSRTSGRKNALLKRPMGGSGSR